MLNKIMFLTQKRSVTVLCQATWGAEAKARICTTDLELEELKNPASSAPLWPCVLGLWGGQRYLRYGPGNPSRPWFFLQASMIWNTQRSLPSSVPQPLKI